MPHGHVEAILDMMRRLKIAPLLDNNPSAQRDLVIAMIAQRILSPGSKLFTTRALQQSTLAEELHIQIVYGLLCDREGRLETRRTAGHRGVDIKQPRQNAENVHFMGLSPKSRG
jgi:hypothetical protein